MKPKSRVTIATITVLLTVLGGVAISAQDKYTLKVPGGLAFSEFRGYETWEVILSVTTENPSRLSSAIPR